MSHTTKPDYYESQLSESASQQREVLEERVAYLYENANKLDNAVLRTKAMRRIDPLETSLSLQGANPKKVPFSILKEHVQSPTSTDPMENKYMARVKNRATAIRAYCVMCMGGDIAGIRLCASLTCPLHPFRNGGDPFRGFELPKFEMPELPEDEEDDNDEFEEGDDGSDADATS